MEIGKLIYTGQFLNLCAMPLQCLMNGCDAYTVLASGGGVDIWDAAFKAPGLLVCTAGYWDFAKLH